MKSSLGRAVLHCGLDSAKLLLHYCAFKLIITLKLYFRDIKVTYQYQRIVLLNPNVSESVIYGELPWGCLHYVKKLCTKYHYNLILILDTVQIRDSFWIWWWLLMLALSVLNKHWSGITLWPLTGGWDILGNKWTLCPQSRCVRSRKNGQS